jgi:hypothetical protein
VLVVRKLVHTGPLRAAVKIPRGAWANLPAVRDLEAQPLCLPGWLLTELLILRENVALELERSDA